MVQRSCSVSLPTANARGEDGANRAAREANGGPGVTTDRLDISELERCAAFFFANGLAASSR